MHSARVHAQVVSTYIEAEVQAGRMLGLKGHMPGQWKLITDLSHPEGGSVNNGTQPHLCSLRCTSVEAVAVAAQQLGRSALLEKLDIKSA